jgi:hypothetical protein
MCKTAVTQAQCQEATGNDFLGCTWFSAFEVSVNADACIYVPAGGACFADAGGGTGCTTTACGFVAYTADDKGLTVGLLGPSGCFYTEGPARWSIQECPDWTQGGPPSTEPADVACYCGCAPGYPG